MQTVASRGIKRTPESSVAPPAVRCRLEPPRVEALRERMRLLNGPALGELLGGGTSSCVFALPDRPAMVAKVMLESMPGGAFAGVEQNERAIGRLLGRHSRLVVAEKLSWYGPYAVLLTVRCETTLEHVIRSHVDSAQQWMPLPVQRRHQYMRHLLDALAFCHVRHVTHRDVKPDNLLIDEHGNLRLSDFGLSRVLTADEARAGGNHLSDYYVVTLHYRALEVLFANQGAVGFTYGFAADVWSAGCVYAEMVQSHALFSGETSIDMVRRICAELGAPDAEAWPHGYNTVGYLLGKHPQRPAEPLSRLGEVLLADELSLLLRLLTLEPTRRINASEALLALVRMPLPTKSALKQ